VTSVERDGKPLTDDALPLGLVESGGDVTLELLPVVDDVAGHWKITILQFYSFDPKRQRIREIFGPWVLEFDIAETR
jgi:hypothetical protein